MAREMPLPVFPPTLAPTNGMSIVSARAAAGAMVPRSRLRASVGRSDMASPSRSPPRLLRRSSGRNGDHAERAAASIHDLERRRNDDRTCRWAPYEYTQNGEAELAGAVHRRVIGKWRCERPSLAGVGPDRLHSDTQDLPVGGKDHRGPRMEAWAVRAIGARIDECSGIGSDAPSRAKEDPRAFGNPPMLDFPRLEPFGAQQEIRIARHFGGHVDDTRRPDEARRPNGIAGVLRQVFPGDPVDGRIEVGAGMLTHADRVPVPGGAFLVVLRDGVDGHAR